MNDPVGTWRKSTFSAAGNCAEINAWRKSEHSGAGDCLEAGHGTAVVGVRDTKQAHLGDARTILEFPVGAWRTFLQGLQ